MVISATGCSPSVDSPGVNSSNQPQNATDEPSANVTVMRPFLPISESISPVSYTSGSYAMEAEAAVSVLSFFGDIVRHAVLRMVVVSVGPPAEMPGGVTDFSQNFT